MNRRGAEGAEESVGRAFGSEGQTGRRLDDVPPTVEPDAELNRLSEAVIGAAMEVHRHLGPGYLEALYEAALAVELRLRGTSFERQVPVPVFYKGCDIGEGRLDFLVEKCLLVELKAIDSLAPIHTAQVISCLKATGLHLGLLINFKVPALRSGIRRVVRS
jgi:GxxExxY protein